MDRVIHIGDKVRFLNENLSGTVSSLHRDGMVGVTIEDGFELQVLARELVVTEALVKQPSETPKTEKPKAPQELNKGVFLLAVRDDKQHWQLSLLNRMGHPLFFAFYRQTPAATELLAHGSMNDGQELPVASMGQALPDKWGKWCLQYLSIRQFPGSIPNLEQCWRSFKQGDFQHTPFRNNGQPLFAFKMEVGYQEPESETKEPLQTPTADKPYVPVNFSRPEEEIDLHADALELDTALPGDIILKKQMEAFQRHLELAVAYGLHRITVIHGVGNGVLKNLILLQLKGHPGVRTWDQADHREYGQGALRITLKQQRAS
ncbi:MAG: Smr/MutS family protein [Bacteroidetes bacterium]|nr:Smr/MutS family protein [Bacteroidota bacterium]